MFADGESSKVAKVNITNDNDPELDESFDVQIFSVSNEGIRGDNNSCKQPSILFTPFYKSLLFISVTVTISANDDPNGRFGFFPSPLSISAEEAGAVVNDDNSMRYYKIV